ncbi:uncharacterized protein LOC143912376 [Arctopsyche grandis]|uniref:uncharacterized protein LOC143912376 n=1 Tax=Arctopsyche grandis TaxID=121162 RepID=UPI00406D7CFE
MQYNILGLVPNIDCIKQSMLKISPVELHFRFRADTMNTTKWLPLESEECLGTYASCKDLENATVFLIIKITNIENTSTFYNDRRMCGKNYVENLDYIQALELVQKTLSKLVKCFFKVNPKLSKIPNSDDNLIIACKKNLTIEILCKKRFILAFLINNLVMCTFKSCLQREEQSKLLEIALGQIFVSILCRLATLYNEMTTLSSKGFISKFNICSNTCPILIHQLKKISVTKLLQVLAQGRAELCCHSLIDCLLSNYKPCNPNDVDTYSDNSSLEIYQALTKHMTPPIAQGENITENEMRIKNQNIGIPTQNENAKNNKAQLAVNKPTPEDKYVTSTCEPTSESEAPYSSMNEYYDETDNTFDMREASSLEGLIQREEFYVETILESVLRISPSMLGTNGVKKMKTGEYRMNRRLAEQIMEFYQTTLWGNVGGFLEHIVLWWGASPLASRPPHSSQHLREWLTSLNSNDVPQLMLIALQSLADALGCHVTSTSWDTLFRQCFVASLRPIPVKSDQYVTLSITQCSEVGACFADMFQDLVMLSNQCEVTSDYIMGAPVDELPLVEQIPNLHRLDHSVHTYRLWCLAETRRLSNLWDMDCFFRIVQNDIQMSLEQLSNLRFADHTIAIESGKLGVHEHVCAKMREKLVSEVNANIQKLKIASDECVQVLAAICGTTSLAHLTMIFPPNSSWKMIGYPPQAKHSRYVNHYLDRVLLPVVKATSDKLIVNMILKIMCESWLQHIYVYKIKFSNAAAEQLLIDFETVKTWLNECKVLSDITRRQMLNNEVLRRCEGVGKLLLHSPGDPISMHDVPHGNQRAASQQDMDSTDDCGEIMPAEMYVPNQQQWLQLRASKTKKRRKFCCVTMTF